MILKGDIVMLNIQVIKLFKKKMEENDKLMGFFKKYLFILIYFSLIEFLI